MIRILFFIAAVLVPGLIYGADPSTTLSVQVVPAGSAPAVPAPAAAAGFTTLAFSSDFTQSSYANRANWLDCAGAATPQWYRAWIGFGAGLAGPCSAITQATDPLTGQPALQMTWQDSFYNGGVPAEVTVIQSVDNSGNGNRIPPNAYFEVTARYDRPVQNGTMDLWSYAANGSSIEWDGVEVYSSNTDAGATFHNNENGVVAQIWNEQDPPGTGPIDYTQYHKWAWRVTSNGTNAGFWCSYTDDHLNGCQSWNPTANELTGLDQTIQIQIAMSCRGVSRPCNNGAPIHAWVKSVNVWSCAGVNSGQKCFTSSANP